MSVEFVPAADERENLPSASIVERLAKCPGSWRMSRGLPELLSPELQKYSESGDRVHLYLQAPELIDLTPFPDELDVAQACQRIHDRVISQTIGKDHLEAREVRRWLMVHGKRAFSAKLDFSGVKHDGSEAVVIDYKSGRGHTAVSSRNLQIRTQIVTLWLELKKVPKVIYGAVVQPLVKVAGGVEICAFNLTDLENAHDELLNILEAAKHPMAPLHPGVDQCKYCPAKLKCPAARSVLEEVAAFDATQVLGVTPDTLGGLLEKCQVAAIIIKAAQSHAKAHLKLNPACIPGWKLKENPPLSEITDAQKAYEAMAAFGFTTADFLDCVRVSIGALELTTQRIAKAQGNEKFTKRQAREVVDLNCAGLITEKPKEPSLEREST